MPIRSESRRGAALTAAACACAATLLALSAAAQSAPAAASASPLASPPAAASAVAAPAASAAPARKPRGAPDIVRDAPASAWRSVDPNDVLAMTLPAGTVYIELAPRFAPRYAANIRTLAAQHYYDGLAVLRVQDNFVAQWGDPNADATEPGKARSLGAAAARLAPEFWVADQGLNIHRLKDRDVWAPVTGFVDGFAVAADPKAHRAWLAHCYGTVGAGRNDAVDSASGAELYVVIGQSPRALDLNITPVGRVLQGMELLSSLPRGTGSMGFYDKPEHNVPIARVQRLADIAPAERPEVQVFRTDTPLWDELVESRRNRQDAWYVHRAGAIDVCNLSVPVRITLKAAAGG